METLNAIQTMNKVVGFNVHLERSMVIYTGHAEPSPNTVDGNTIKEVDS